jgi:hypothetical protein
MKDWIIKLLANRLGASWRTGILGLMLILAGVSKAGVALFDGDAATTFSWEETSTAVLAGWALMLARDNKTTSEQVIASRKDEGDSSNPSSDKPVQ